MHDADTVESKPKHVVPLATILVITGLYLLTVREGHHWGGDFSLYILHARNLAEGIRYGDTCYIFNPERASLSPTTYPPVLPIMLAPVYRLFGLNLTAMKVEMILMFGGFLLVSYLLFVRYLHGPYAIGALLAIGLNPYLWEFKDSVQSDIPFLFFLFATFLVVDRIYFRSAESSPGRLDMVLSGVLVYLCYGTRSVGMVLAPALLLTDVIVRRRPTWFPVGALIVACLLAGAQAMVFHSDGNYLRLLWAESPLSPRAMYSNLYYYAQTLDVLWDSRLSYPLLRALSVAILCLTVLGYVRKMRTRPGLMEAFIPFYLAVLSVWPSNQPRFIIPLLPCCVFYSCVAVEGLVGLRYKRLSTAGLALIVLALLFSYGARYAQADFRRFKEGVGKTESVQLFSFIREQTSKGSVFIFRKPRVLCLYTGRPAAIYHEPSDEKGLWEFFGKIKATYLVEGSLDSVYWHAFIGSYKDNLENVYQNRDFRVFRISRYPF